MARCCRESERGGIGVDVRVELEEGLVDASELFRAQVLVVDPSADAAVDGERERPNRFQETRVRKLTRVETGRRLRAPEERPESGKTQLRASRGRAELFEDEPEGTPKVGMRGASSFLRESTEPSHRVVAGVTLCRGRTMSGDEEETAVLGDEQENQPVDRAQELAVVVLLRKGPFL